MNLARGCALGLAARSMLLALCAAIAGAAEASDPGDGPWRVVDPAGQGVSGAAVTVYGVPVTESPIERVSTRISTATSREEGVIDGGLPQVEELVLAVDHPRFAPSVVAGPPESLRVLRLRPGKAWSGRVQGAGERPVAAGEACVSVSLEAPRLQRQLDFVRCGAIEAGRFTVEGLPEGASGHLRVTAPGYLPLTASHPPAAAAELILQPGFLLSGRVGGAGGEGLQGASVAVADGESTESGPDGGFAVRAPGLPAQVTFRAPGHRERVLTVTTADPDEPLVVQLVPGPTLAARILGGDGRAPESGVVSVLGYRPERAEWGSVDRVSLAAGPNESTEDGSAMAGDHAAGTAAGLELVIDLPGEGEYRLVIAARGYSRHREPTFAVGAVGHVDLGLIHLSQGAGVTAKVVDALSGEPVPGVLGQLSPTGTVGVLEVVGEGPAAATSDAEGRLRIVGQEAGLFDLKLSHRDHGSRVLDVELERDEVRDLGSVWLGPGTEVEGRVTDRSGEPRPGLRVRIVGAAVGSLAAVAERATDFDGRFAPARLGAGEYRVEVHGGNLLLDQGLTIADGQPEVDLDLQVGGTRWRGRVYRGDDPVTGGTLLVRPLSDTAHQRGRVMVTSGAMKPQILGDSGATSRASVDREGRFELPDAPTGLVLATYFANDGHEARERLIVPAEAEVHQDIRLTDSELDGVVLDAETGAALAGALLRLRDPMDTVVAQAVTGEDGAFRLAGFDLASSYQLEAELEGYRPRLLRGLVVEERDSPLQVLLQPTESSSLRVRLQRADGSPAARATISLFSEGGWMLRSLILDSYGEIVFDDVPPGSYFLLWHDPLTGAGASPISVGDGEASRFDQLLTPGALLTVDCGEGCAGDPLPAIAVLHDRGVELTSHLPSISPALRFSSTGRLVLGRVQPGTYIIRSWLGGGWRDHRVTARAAETVEVALGE